MDPSWKCALAVPASVMDTWEEQYYQHTDQSMRFVPVVGSPQEKRRIIESTRNEKKIILLFSIEDLRGRSDAEFEAISEGLDMVAVDEGQRIENFGGMALKTSSLQAKAIHKLKTPRRWILSATPYTSDFRQLFSVFNLLHTDPETGAVTNPLFQTRQAFNRVFAGTVGSMKWMYALKARVSLRRKKTEQGRLYTKVKEIDPEEEGEYFVTPGQAELCVRIIKNLGEYIKIYNARLAPGEEPVSLRSLSVFLKLQFLSFALTDPTLLGENVPTTYWDSMDRIVEKRVSEKKPGIVFAENTAIIDKTVERYRAKGFRVARIDGTVDGQARSADGRPVLVRFEGGQMVEDPNGHPISAQAYQRHLFQSGQADVVVMNRRAGVGLDLSRAEWELFAQMPDNYVSYYQSRDRGIGLNSDPTGKTQKEVEVLFLMPRYPRTIIDQLAGTADQMYVEHGTPSEILYRLMMGEQKDQFKLVMDGIPPEMELTAEETLRRLVHSVRGFLEDPSMSQKKVKQARQMNAANALFPLYKKAGGDLDQETEVLELVDNFSRTESSPDLFARLVGVASEFDLKDLSYINALFRIPNKQHRDQLLGMLPDLYGLLLENNVSLTELAERGPPALSRMAQEEPELLIPLVMILHGWNTTETDEQVLEPKHPGAVALLQILEEIMSDGLSNYDQQQWMKRFIYGAIPLIDASSETFLEFVHRYEADLLDESLSLNERITFLERLALLRMTNPNQYVQILSSTQTFFDVHDSLRTAITESFIAMFNLPRDPATISRIEHLAERWGGLSAPLQLLGKLMAGDPKEYGEHVSLFKRVVRHIVNGTYADWRNAQSLDPTGHEIEFLKENNVFWSVFTREDRATLGKVTVTPKQLAKAKQQRIQDVLALLQNPEAMTEAFGDLASQIQSDLSKQASLDEINQEIALTGRQRGALTADQTDAIAIINSRLEKLRLRHNVVSLNRVLGEEDSNLGTRSLDAVLGFLQTQASVPGKYALAQALTDLKSVSNDQDKSRTFEEVEITFTSDPDLIMRRGMLAEDMKNCFNLAAKVPQIATLVDDLASRNKMLALVKVKGRVAAVAMIKVRQTNSGDAVLMVERPLFRFGYSFEREIAEALKETKLGELPGVAVAGDIYKGDEKNTSVQLRGTGARGPTEYHESLFRYCRRSAGVTHIAGVLVEKKVQRTHSTDESSSLIDDSREGISRIRVSVRGEAREVIGLGHSVRSEEKFLSLLRQLGIKRLVDLRSIPMSRYNPQFNQHRLRGSLAAAGIEYVWMGERLGGKLPAFKGDFEAYMQADPQGQYNQGMEELRGAITTSEGPLAVMCSEKDPSNCHRRFILAELGGETGSQRDLFGNYKDKMTLIPGSKFYERFIAPLWESPGLALLAAGIPAFLIQTILSSAGISPDTIESIVYSLAAFYAFLASGGKFISIDLFKKLHPTWRNLGRAPDRAHWVSTGLSLGITGLYMVLATLVGFPLTGVGILAAGSITYAVAHTAIHLYHNISVPREQRMSLRFTRRSFIQTMISALARLSNPLEKATRKLTPETRRIPLVLTSSRALELKETFVEEFHLVNVPMPTWDGIVRERGLNDNALYRWTLDGRSPSGTAQVYATELLERMGGVKALVPLFKVLTLEEEPDEVGLEFFYERVVAAIGRRLNRLGMVNGNYPPEEVMEYISAWLTKMDPVVVVSEIEELGISDWEEMAEMAWRNAGISETSCAQILEQVKARLMSAGVPRHVSSHGLGTRPNIPLVFSDVPLPKPISPVLGNAAPTQPLALEDGLEMNRRAFLRIVSAAVSQITSALNYQGSVLNTGQMERPLVNRSPAAKSLLARPQGAVTTDLRPQAIPSPGAKTVPQSAAPPQIAAPLRSSPPLSQGRSLNAVYVGGFISQVVAERGNHSPTMTAGSNAFIPPARSLNVGTIDPRCMILTDQIAGALREEEFREGFLASYKSDMTRRNQTGLSPMEALRILGTFNGLGRPTPTQAPFVPVFLIGVKKDEVPEIERFYKSLQEINKAAEENGEPPAQLVLAPLDSDVVNILKQDYGDRANIGVLPSPLVDDGKISPARLDAAFEKWRTGPLGGASVAVNVSLSAGIKIETSELEKLPDESYLKEILVALLRDMGDLQPRIQNFINMIEVARAISFQA